MTPQEILRHAANLIDTGAWCQKERAQTEQGEWTSVRHPAAARFCADGALMRVCGVDTLAAHDPPGSPIGQAFRALTKACGMNAIVYNDEPGRKASEVAAKMLEAAELLDKEAA